MNIPLLKKIQKHIKEEPRRLNMDDWILRKDEFIQNKKQLAYVLSRKIKDIPKCGTVCCIAGWADVLSGNGQFSYNRAKTILNLTSDQASQLFFVGGWPKEFRSEFESTLNLKKRANITVNRITHFIKTGGKE